MQAAAVKVNVRELTAEQHRELWALQQQQNADRRRKLAAQVEERTRAWALAEAASVAPAVAARERVVKLAVELAKAREELDARERDHAGREHLALGGVEAARRELERLTPDPLAAAIDALVSELDRARRGVPLAEDSDRPAQRRRVIEVEARLREARALVYVATEPAELLRVVERLTAGL
ncbi:MAG: hypothetical protein MUF27_01950 [Acidobacteria bacterium]|jgi:hypothetical protein|nr:hypothetical protein [Acidobacteriota bacterium]